MQIVRNETWAIPFINILSKTVSTEIGTMPWSKSNKIIWDKIRTDIYLMIKVPINDSLLEIRR